MKKILRVFALVLSAVLLCMIFTACGGQKKRTLRIFNWGDYMDPEILDMFMERYPDVKIIYDTFETNEQMYAKIKSGGTDYDLLFPSDYMIARMIKEDMLAKIDVSQLKNYDKIGDEFKGLIYDENNEYSVPYTWGTVGILYNTEMVDDPVDSWDILWNEKYSKQILMLDSSRDTIGVALKKLGYSLNSTNIDELNAARDALKEQYPLVKQYVGDQLRDKMANGEAALAVCWSGDAMQAVELNDKLDYAIPKEGTNIWYDAMVIPKTSKNKDLAMLFIDFLLETEIAVKNTEYLVYSTPHKEAFELLDESLKNNPIFNPPKEVLQNPKNEVFLNLEEATKEYDRIWNEIGIE